VNKISIPISNIKKNDLDNILVLPTPKAERGLLEHVYLKKYFGVKFCTDEKRSDFPFFCDTIFSMFAVDLYGNCIGTLGDVGTLADDNYKVGVINPLKKNFGTITDSIHEFLELYILFPKWYSEITKELSTEESSIISEEAVTYLSSRFKLEQHCDLIKKTQTNIQNTNFLVYEKKGNMKQYYKLICD